MEKKISTEKAPKIVAGVELELGGIRRPAEEVGEKKNYNLQPGVTPYDLWPFSTIEWAVTQGKFRARVILRHTTSHDLVAVNSWHEDYADAERAIDLVSDSLNDVGERHVYNIFAETLEVHTADIGAGAPVTVLEVLGLIWSMRQIAAA